MAEIKMVEYLGYWGNPNDPEEDAAMGLTVGNKYTVVEYYECGGEGKDAHLLPKVYNNHGKLVELEHDEYVEVTDEVK